MEGKLNQLFEKYLNNQCSDEEIIALLEYFKMDEQEPMLRELIMQELQRSGAPNISIDRIEERLDLVYAHVNQYITQDTVPVVRKVKLWPRIVAVAAAFAVVVSGVYFFNYRDYKIATGSAYIHDIAPGKVGATLTLANGKKIRLSDAANGEIAKEAGSAISKTANGQVVYEMKENAAESNKINTLTTALGETYILILPDKSKVWMNAASSLTYAVTLNEGGVRRVRLEGEAYFEVSKDKAHPFIVESGNQQVEVLGTHFNVNAYKDETVIRTTLLEGSVRLSENGISKMLTPGNQATNQAGKINIHEANTSLVTAWKNNKFIFDRLSIQEIMRMVSRWYNVEIIYQGTAPVESFWGSVSRFENVSEVLSPLEKTGNVHFKIEGRRIYVSR